MERIESICSSECKLFLMSICSVRIRSRNRDIQNFCPKKKSDVVYKFAWCIDACIRARQISELHQRELFEFLSTVRFWVAKTAKIRHNSNRTYTYEK